MAEDKKLPSRQRRSGIVLFEKLQAEGYAGSYDSVRRHVRYWRIRQSSLAAEVYIPLVFDPGEAFQFDWSHEWVEMAGMPVKVKVAHLRLCHSRHFLVVAYPRETREMVFDAHMRGFEFFGGVCRRGIYDNLKAVVNKVSPFLRSPSEGQRLCRTQRASQRTLPAMGEDPAASGACRAERVAGL